jgi:Transposase DDE domain
VTANQILRSIQSICKGAWKRHIVNLALLVHAAFECRRLGIAALGRAMRCATSPKHSIKRADRFFGNERFDHWMAQEQLLRAVIGPRKTVFIPVDWTKVREWPALVAGVVKRGRAVPVAWAVLGNRALYKSQNAFENGFFSWLAQALPEGVRVIILLDRGFKRVSLVKHLRRCGLSFVIRTGGNVAVRHPSYTGRMDELVQRRGDVVDLPDASLHSEKPTRVRVVGVWERGQKEPWLLMTDLEDNVATVAAAYGRRFRIEETFRDEKDTRFGLALGQLKMTKADRLERMLFVAALVHFVAMLVGGAARRLGLDRQYRANTVRTKPTHSDFTLGLYFLSRLRLNFAELLRDCFSECEREFWG